MDECTLLYEWHATYGRRFINFRGSNMPLHYGSQIAEQKAAREQAVAFDISHGTYRKSLGEARWIICAICSLMMLIG